MNMNEAVPNTWDLDTIGKVRCLYSEGWVDQFLAQRAQVDVVALTRETLADILVREAHALAVEIHPGDLEFRDAPSDSVPFTIHVQARWAPKTNEIELRGGHVDGTVMAWQWIGEPIRIPRPSSPIHMPADALYPATSVLTFEMVGWSESSRRWVYAARD